MAEEKRAEKPQGFVIVAENNQEEAWALGYFSKIRGEKEKKICGPNLLEILRAIEGFLLEQRRVVILFRPHPEESKKEELFRQIRNYYRKIKIKVVRMLPA